MTIQRAKERLLFILFGDLILTVGTSLQVVLTGMEAGNMINFSPIWHIAIAVLTPLGRVLPRFSVLFGSEEEIEQAIHNDSGATDNTPTVSEP